MGASAHADSAGRQNTILAASVALVAVGAGMLVGAHLYKASQEQKVKVVSVSKSLVELDTDAKTAEKDLHETESASSVETRNVDSDYTIEEEEEDDDGNSEGTDAIPDIEDMMGKSLIPATLKEMKSTGVRPYTTEEKAKKIHDLEAMEHVPKFSAKLRESGVKLHREAIEVMQLNIGFYCNQACTHCHVDSSPLRKQMMTREIADKCIDIVRKSPSINVVDLTGGAPELNREFRYLVEECTKLGKEVIDRCNLTVLLEPHQDDLPAFLAKHKVRVIASLPCYLEDNVNKQRGDKIFQRSIKGLQLLNAVGYGKPGTGLHLDLVYNPTGIHLPPNKTNLIGDYKRVLKGQFDIVFNDLHCITNMPLNRFYDYLREQDRLEEYMSILVNAYNPEAAEKVMCRKYLSVGPTGEVFDCDFNQQLELHLRLGEKVGLTVFDFDNTDELRDIAIVTRKHCYGCTAGAGSSCRQE